MSPTPEPTPVFVVGVGRSGTSLLMAMLHAHPDIAMAPETHFIRRYVASGGTVSVEEARRILEQDGYVARLGLDPRAVLRGVPVKNGKLAWRDLYWAMLSSYREGKGKTIIGDKDPRLVELIPLLRRCFPRGKLLHVIRDPRDVYLSRTKAAWSAGRHWFSQMMAYRIQYGLGRSEGRRLFGANYLEVFYEQLLDNPRGVLTAVCSLLGVSFAESMLEYSRSSDEIVAPDERPWKQNLEAPLMRDNVNKWRGRLSRRDVARIECICDRPFRERIYQRAESSLPANERLQAAALSSIAGAVESAYRARRSARMIWTLPRMTSPPA